MKLFFDESGYSGCIMPNKNGQLFNDGQRHFVLGSVFVADKEDEIEILNKYRQFKNCFGFIGEIKGSELMTQRNNEALKYFITNVLDDKHFFICNYDKIFYLATLISVYIFGVPFQQQETLTFYMMASALAGEKEELFLHYCSAVCENTDNSKKEFLEYLISFPYEKLDRNDYNLYIAFAKLMLENKDYGEFPLTYEAYSCKNTVNFVNMTALGETLLSLKHLHGVDMGKTEIYHDSTQSKYFVASRKFELPELKLLIDAVESSKFITKKKSETLIEKIHTMTSPGQVAKLKRNNYVVNRIKPDNEQIYYIIDAINDAINAGKQISFQYYDYTGLKKKVLKNKGEVYKLSPYKLLWCGDYYYVLGYSEKKSKVINFRVDRIASKPEILDKDIIPMPDDFDIENYTKEVFFMFSGEKVLVDLRCDNSLMKTMVDRFGEDVTTLAYDMTSFRVQTEVSASPTFFGWVFGFNGKVQILAPESVKEQYKQMIAQADEGMQEKGNKEQEM